MSQSPRAVCIFLPVLLCSCFNVQQSVILTLVCPSSLKPSFISWRLQFLSPFDLHISWNSNSDTSLCMCLTLVCLLCQDEVEESSTPATHSVQVLDCGPYCKHFLQNLLCPPILILYTSCYSVFNKIGRLSPGYYIVPSHPSLHFSGNSYTPSPIYQSHANMRSHAHKLQVSSCETC